MDEDEYLSLSGIQHFAYCRRRWALIHIEQDWQDNYLTAKGEVMHDRAHDETIRERRGSLLVVRGLRVHSNELGLYGNCDVVEFHQDPRGCVLTGEEGLWAPLPVEYKKGKGTSIEADSAQLCAEAICLEEMLCCEINSGYLYYGDMKSRKTVTFDSALRDTVKSYCHEMHQYYQRGYVPKSKRSNACKSCSMIELCLPQTDRRKTVEDYLDDFISG